MTRFLCMGIALFFAGSALAHRPLSLVTAKAKNKHDRNRIASTGVAIDEVHADSVRFLASPEEIAALRKLNIALTIDKVPEPNRDFPSEDAHFHSYDETKAELDRIEQAYPDLAKVSSIGKSVEGRELYAIRLSLSPVRDSLPTAIFLGCHHAREHLSVEMPLKLAAYLAEHSSESRVQDLLRTREIWIVPMVNPDGAEHDIKDGDYQWWRKNRSQNENGSIGVDLNRNYGGKGWGGAGSSGSPGSDTYHGKEAFSEPETRAVRDFVRSRSRATVLLTFHTFSELVLWPWGHTNDEIENTEDRRVFETMGKKMASMNKYTAEKSSDLYLNSGDTTDWAYDELKLFAFTFELSPSSLFGGGFYPGAKAIEPTFKANLEPSLYLIEHAENPYALDKEVTDPLGIL